jgi:hypothetical protein
VIAFMSAKHLDPDIAAERFVLHAHAADTQTHTTRPVRPCGPELA